MRTMRIMQWPCFSIELAAEYPVKRMETLVAYLLTSVAGNVKTVEAQRTLRVPGSGTD
jgi:ribulose 1,5-bisphosphate carboxylase large subunit-like protein